VGKLRIGGLAQEYLSGSTVITALNANRMRVNSACDAAGFTGHADYSQAECGE
jgi:hypothetical protein